MKTTTSSVSKTTFCDAVRAIGTPTRINHHRRNNETGLSPQSIIGRRRRRRQRRTRKIVRAKEFE